MVSVSVSSVSCQCPSPSPLRLSLCFRLIRLLLVSVSSPSPVSVRLRLRLHLLSVSVSVSVASVSVSVSVSCPSPASVRLRLLSLCRIPSPSPCQPRVQPWLRHQAAACRRLAHCAYLIWLLMVGGMVHASGKPRRLGRRLTASCGGHMRTRHATTLPRRRGLAEAVTGFEDDAGSTGETGHDVRCTTRRERQGRI